MGRHFSHLNTAVKILRLYDGSQPFNNFIKAFFSQEKKYGSKDRKHISTLCYAFFRSANLHKKDDISEKIIASAFLLDQNENDFIAELRPEWNGHIGSSMQDKLSLIGKSFDQIFPFLNDLSPEIDRHLFAASLFIQPALFLRIRPGKNQQVEQKLTAASVSFEQLASDCISLPNSTRTEDLLKINDEVVVQDRNSQRVLDYLMEKDVGKDDIPAAWDCCAASGGKTILLFDRMQGKVRLTVTDIRETILSRLHTRLHIAGIKLENSYLADLADAGLPASDTFKIILCDVPCTGSGTWARTPEQMYYFQNSKISMYAAKQKQIIANSIASLDKDSLFFYITCSVFSEENEQQAIFIKKNFPVTPVYQAYLKGYEEKADTMFVAVFKSA